MTEKSGLMEQIMVAVKPLSSNSDFHLQPIEFGYYAGELTVAFASTGMDLIFRNRMREHTRVDCYIKVHSVKKILISKYLFPVLGIKSNFENGYPILDYSNPITKDIPEKYQIETEYLMQKSGLIRELHRQCCAINENMVEIQNRLNAEHINETIRRYILELKKNGLSEELVDMKI